jgi:hypothetical protein
MMRKEYGECIIDGIKKKKLEVSGQEDKLDRVIALL